MRSEIRFPDAGKDERSAYRDEWVLGGLRSSGGSLMSLAVFTVILGSVPGTLLLILLEMLFTNS